MKNFSREYARLNTEQREAVDNINGPVLVVAGPGTGKTQLLSMRVANILKKTDVLPGNILCLTFTDNAARNMRDRLASIIGQPAYHVSIHTFHSFGSEIITQYPEHFGHRLMVQQIDELGRYELLYRIILDLPHTNPLGSRIGNQSIYIKDCLDIISWLKQNALEPRELRMILAANRKFFEAISDAISQAFVNSPSAKNIALYNNLLETIRSNTEPEIHYGFPGYAVECASELEKAITSVDPAGRYAKPITAWRDSWCKKDRYGNFVLKDGDISLDKMDALAEVYEKLSDVMAKSGLYDFDDMVIEAVHVIEGKNKELKYNLQEKYQYILVDEFQDTNKAQFRMLAALGDNPVNENKPNIMAVGDDDQAIYAFQGAEVSNMALFTKQYPSAVVISLRENFRSNPDILEASSSVAKQITNRLDHLLPLSAKTLEPKVKHKINELNNFIFLSELAQYEWISSQIRKLIDEGTQPNDIAIIAPRHKYLERLMPYLGHKKIPVAYERRENILEAPLIKQLSTMAKLVVSIAENHQDNTDFLIAEVLNYEFWQIQPDELIKISIQAYDKHSHWLDLLSKHSNSYIQNIAFWFVDLARRSTLEPMEYILDRLTGKIPHKSTDELDETLHLSQTADPTREFVSPLGHYYFSESNYNNATDSYLVLLGQLSTLRQRLRQWRPSQTQYIKDFVDFIDLNAAAGLKIIDTNPHTQSTNAVQVMTSYKAKGLEFGTVFMINAQDEIWGPTAKSGSSRIILPKNLTIAPRGNDDNDKLRLLFVSMTRAKHTLFITGYERDLDNKISPALSFLLNHENRDQAIHMRLSPKHVDIPPSTEAIQILSTDWAYRFRQVIADKQVLLEPVLKNYKLSVTHLNNFIDIRNGGPKYFMVHNLLRFPVAVSPSAAYGDAIHKTLQWIYKQIKTSDNRPKIVKINNFYKDQLARKHLKNSDFVRLESRGIEALDAYIKRQGKLFSHHDVIERGFSNEGVMFGSAHLSGKIDKMRLTAPGSMEVIDFKTGKPSRSWQGRDEFEKIKLHKYEQQLMFYKLLVENSATYSGKVTVRHGSLEFIETDNGTVIDNLILNYTPEKLEKFGLLIQSVWGHINSLNFPDVDQYPKTFAGILLFENDLINGAI